MTLWEIHIKTILSGTSSSIRTKLWWNSHWMVLFQNCVRQSKLSHQDGHHSAVALLLKAALIQVSDYRLQGASGYSNIKILKFYENWIFWNLLKFWIFVKFLIFWTLKHFFFFLQYIKKKGQHFPKISKFSKIS